MSAALIIDRIRASLAAGELAPMPDPAAALSIRTIGELLGMWPDGCVLADSTTYLRKPRFTPRPRRSGRPLPPPRRVVAATKPISGRLLASMSGIWSYLEATGKAAPDVLQVPVASGGIEKIVDLLSVAVADYWPLGSCLEDYTIDDRDLASQDGVCLILPHLTYEDEAAGVFEAFLSGYQSVHAWMESAYDAMQHDPFDLVLPEKDHALIKKVGFAALLETYAGYAGEKAVDLNRLENFWEAFFGKMVAEFPRQSNREWPIISGNGGQDLDLVITSAEDIRFALAYARSWEAMLSAMPDPWQLDQNDNGETEIFIHEVCNVWRKANNKRALKWTSPKQQTLAFRLKNGEIEL